LCNPWKLGCQVTDDLSYDLAIFHIFTYPISKLWSCDIPRIHQSYNYIKSFISILNYVINIFYLDKLFNRPYITIFL